MNKRIWTVGFSLIVMNIGCGNISSSKPMQAPSGSYGKLNYGFTDTDSSDANSNFSCPSLPNVLPQTTFNLYDYNAPVDADVFTVCKSRSSENYSDLLIHGRTINSQSICIFPLHHDARGNMVGITDKSGTLISACAPATAKGVFVSIPQTGTGTFDTVAIVEAPDQILMKACILDNFMNSNCPSYSAGQFR